MCTKGLPWPDPRAGYKTLRYYASTPSGGANLRSDRRSFPRHLYYSTQHALPSSASTPGGGRHIVAQGFIPCAVRYPARGPMWRLGKNAGTALGQRKSIPSSGSPTFAKLQAQGFTPCAGGGMTSSLEMCIKVRVSTPGASCGHPLCQVCPSVSPKGQGPAFRAHYKSEQIFFGPCPLGLTFTHT
jgi:hypothetical protein